MTGNFKAISKEFFKNICFMKMCLSKVEKAKYDYQHLKIILEGGRNK